MASFSFSRRALLLGAGAGLACGRKKATGFPGYCFVANEDGHSLAVVDLTNFRLWRPVRLDAAPTAVLPHPHPRVPKVFALAAATGTLYEIDVASLAVARRARAGNQAVGMLLAPAGDAIWVSYRDPAALIEFPLDLLQPRRRIRLPGPPDDFDLSGARAAIALGANRAVVFASLEHASIERIVTIGREAAAVRFQQKGAQAAAGSAPDRSLTIIDSATGAIVVRLPLPIEPRHFCFYDNGGQLFISGKGKDAVVIAYPYQTEIGETILAGRAPGAMATVDSYLLVTNPETNSVTVLDIETRKLAAVVQVGQSPRSIIITPDQQYALVLNETSGDLAVIRIASLAKRRYKSAPLFTLVPVGAKPVSAAVVSLA